MYYDILETLELRITLSLNFYRLWYIDPIHESYRHHPSFTTRYVLS